MRFSDREAVHAIRARLEPLGRTGLSIVYTEKGNSKSARKAAGFWLDSEMYDHAAFAEDTSNLFKREAAIYEALSSHPCILKCIGVELMHDEEEAWALYLERAPHKYLREYIGKNEPPTMARRLQVAVDFTEALQYVHDRGVIWGHVSPRSVIVFDDLHIKLCDFAGSTLKGSVLEKELFVLGTTICEITEWTVPYGSTEIEELQQKLTDGEYPHVGDNNPVKDAVKKLWRFAYSSAQELAEALRAALIGT
ncbi:TKL kinase [Fusarium mundagurra]|uniref:TKL kinase n=1 Tax=Fusarium mundagurra TaxID=1567541 RepID=A0A8H5XN87_9HYPO|nr:TKL kinase [Fusarium mundagurra]